MVNPWADGMGDEFPSGQQSLEILNGPRVNTVEIYGQGLIPTTINISRVGEHSPERDAILLDAFLSTSLDENTFRALINIFVKKYISPYMGKMEAEIAEKAELLEPKPVKRRRKLVEEEE